MKKTYCLHPILMSVFPILFLYTHNITQASLEELIGPVIISIAAASMLWMLVFAVYRDPYKSGFLASLILLLFYSYGYFYKMIEGLGISVFGSKVGENKLLLAAYLFIMIFAFISVYRHKASYVAITKILNAFSTVLIGICLISLIVYFVGKPAIEYDLDLKVPGPLSTKQKDELTSKPLPDIYYLILDGYAAKDTLEKIYGYDNGKFYEFLKSKGFVIPADSYSNYPVTYLSIASSLNFDYVNPLSAEYEEDSSYPILETLLELMEDNVLIKHLKTYGYKYVHVSSSGFWMTRKNKNADLNIRCRWGGEFLTILMKSTMLNLFEPLIKNEYRERELNAFKEIADIKSRYDGPKFIFAHFLIPHPPYVFGKNGEKVDEPGVHIDFMSWGGENKKLYLNQLIYTNKKLMEMLEEIMEDPNYKPVIILQADHGPASKMDWKAPDREMLEERFGILNAYLVPEDMRKFIYDGITPVNSFRLILREIFGEDIDTLPDRSYTLIRKWGLVDVTKVLDGSLPESEWMSHWQSLRDGRLQRDESEQH